VTIKGIGIVGDGPYRATFNGKHTLEYNTWYDMLSRCYDPRYWEKYPTYFGCSVVEEWKNFQVFAEWFTSHRNYGKVGFQLDKDLMYFGNRLYSPTTCDVIPRAVNSAMLVPSVSKNSKFIGIHWCKRDKRYIASIRIDGKKVKLGYFKDEDSAVEAYFQAKRENLLRLACIYKGEIHPLIYENLCKWDGKLPTTMLPNGTVPFLTK